MLRPLVDDRRLEEMLVRRQLPALLLAFKPLRAAACITPPGAMRRVLHVAPVGAAATLLAPLAARIAALSGGAVELREGAGGAVLGALAGDAPAPHPALLPFAGFPFGMGAAELRHWLGTADGAALWRSGFAACGAQAWPVAVATRRGGNAPAYGTAGEVQLRAAPEPALGALLARACDAHLEAPPWPAAPGALRDPQAAAVWLRMQLDTPDANKFHAAERFVAGRIAALASGALTAG